MTRLHLKFVLVAMALIAAACGKPQEAALQPIEPTRNTACALDGMLLLDYPGPKAQIHYDQGPPDFFCDTVEMFSIYLKPEQQKRIKGIFTQDMGKADWDNPRDHWIDAKTAFYVLGSKKLGSMGPTLAAFAKQEDAQAFARQYGGKVLKFDEVKPDMVILDGGVMRDQPM